MLRRSGVYCPSSEGIIGGRWLGRWVGDSNSVDLSALGLDLLGKWCVFVAEGVMCR